MGAANDKPLRATALNLSTLQEVFAGRTRVPNRFERPDLPHLRRCLRAGLARVEGDEFVLTPQGVSALSRAGD